jgi:hypothetical protein
MSTKKKEPGKIPFQRGARAMVTIEPCSGIKEFMDRYMLPTLTAILQEIGGVPKKKELFYLAMGRERG